MIDYFFFLNPWSVSSEDRDTQKYINNDSCVTPILSPYVLTKCSHVIVQEQKVLKSVYSEQEI